MNLTTDRTNLIEIKNKNISKNVLLKSSSILFKNKLLEQKKYQILSNDNIEIPNKQDLKLKIQISPVKIINSIITGKINLFN